MRVPRLCSVGLRRGVFTATKKRGASGEAAPEVVFAGLVNGDRDDIAGLEIEPAEQTALERSAKLLGLNLKDHL